MLDGCFLPEICLVKNDNKYFFAADILMIRKTFMMKSNGVISLHSHIIRNTSFHNKNLLVIVGLDQVIFLTETVQEYNFADEHDEDVANRYDANTVVIQQGKVENFKQPLRDVRTDNTVAVGSGFRSNERFHPHQASNWEKV